MLEKYIWTWFARRILNWVQKSKCKKYKQTLKKNKLNSFAFCRTNCHITWDVTNKWRLRRSFSFCGLTQPPAPPATSHRCDQSPLCAINNHLICKCVSAIIVIYSGGAIGSSLGLCAFYQRVTDALCPCAQITVDSLCRV